LNSSIRECARIWLKTAAKLCHFHSFFFATLISVGEIARRLGFNKYGKLFGLPDLGHYHSVNWYVHAVNSAFELHGNIHAKAERSRWHSVETRALASGKLLVAARFELCFDGGELPLFLRVPDDPRKID